MESLKTGLGGLIGDLANDLLEGKLLTGLVGLVNNLLKGLYWPDRWVA